MKRILVVDDSSTMRRMVMASLRSIEGAEFREAENGLAAIERLATERVDLVILDLNMPDMHGMEVLAFIRKHATFHDVPIIVLTTRGDDESRVAANEAGASLYVTKPFEPNTLASGAREFLKIDVE